MKKNLIIDSIIDSELINPGSVVIVGLSGGPDSLCLLHALYSISDAYELTLVPVHINHKLRPEADDEAMHVGMICDKMDLDCEMFEIDCNEVAETLGISTEEAGREIRYNIFDEVAEDIIEEGVEEERVVIALGHNADDQAETVLFRFIRGTGIHGLAGIPPYRISERGHTIVRPLLAIKREEIEQYIADNKLKPNIDKSNSENTYTRNKIRNELIPYLEEKYNPNIREAMRRYASMASMDDSLITEIAFTVMDDEITIDDDSATVTLDAGELCDNHPAVLSRVVRIVLCIIGLESEITYELVTALMDLIYSDDPSSSINLPQGFVAYREYDDLIITEAEQEIIRPDESIEIQPQVIMLSDFHPDEDVPYAAFDFDKFNEEHPGKIGDLVLRTRQEGDYLPIRNGNKKIQDVLVDDKVIKNARDSLLMVAIGDEVLWILPSEYFNKEQEAKKGKFSPKYHIDDTTERVLFIELTDAM